jgi:cytochrome c-type biogenesis protein
MELTTAALLIVPLGLGLLGFIEPCSIGATLIFIKFLEGKSASTKLAQVGVLAITRALFTGLMGVVAVMLGTALIGFQKAAWIALGGGYVLIGLFYVTDSNRALMMSFGPSIPKFSGTRSSAALGVLFSLNIPACAGPLIFAVLGAAAAGGASGATVAAGFVSLAVFGLTLSLPLVAAVLFRPARQALDWLAGLSGRVPFWTGVVLIALGLWSLWFGLFVDVKP